MKKCDCKIMNTLSRYPKVWPWLGVAGYALDGAAQPARLVLPERPASERALNGIEIDFTAGFGEAGADVPDTLKRALLLHVAAMFELRGVVSLDAQPGAVPEPGAARGYG